ncbi:thiamine phosphate synthase [Colwellia hornerae]|uniref:Thiamine-phosphate synthase n=1 Tax=Colwellia hornerae TaxID=89402 RepID=A0A5C6QKX1_9GAMM|nr:thiamine phosphate synthase [Colwellia hornerae]TWX58535.1 thiamine phosphate synthase [Colwellia hornerae]TWX59601.1 thiamine phosphate synthase [Colwellia hornerae]TWX69327.1 thiamine phosphate synthase [Colwellia hornerae]
MTKSVKEKPIVWTISGSDCSGGAGIAADIKTGHALGVEVCHLITANTVQNANRLVSINPVASEILQQQAKVLIDDKPPSVIKIGLIANLEQVKWLSELLAGFKAKYSKIIVVFDPVGQASVGGSFSALQREDLTLLFHYVDVITPNLMEAQQLSNLSTLNPVELATKIAELGIASVIVKGGHSNVLDHDGLPVSGDYCLHRVEQSSISYQLSSPRINTSYSHGGGCSFASALAAFLAQGYLLRDAFTLTKAFINQGLAKSVTTSMNKPDYYGAFEQTYWPDKADFFPRISSNLAEKHQGLPPFPSLALTDKKLGLYPVVDSLYWLKRILPLGLDIIQLRLKNKTDSELEQLIIAAIAISQPYKTRLFINDYWQLAIKHRAYGVHIGQEDLQDADLTKIQQSGLRLGISTHGCYEFLLAQQLQPSYLAIGAIFSTKTKNMSGQIQGVENLQHLLKLASNIPVVAIGGINHQRAERVWQTGVDSIAVVTAVTESENAEIAVKQFQHLMQ